MCALLNGNAQLWGWVGSSPTNNFAGNFKFTKRTCSLCVTSKLSIFFGKCTLLQKLTQW